MQKPRNKESEVYDFIGNELDEIKDKFSITSSNRVRADKWTALALKSRVMLYAASLAKYNNLMPSPITLPGGEVGISADMADSYYEKSLAASQQIINEGPFSLYNANPDKKQNFYELFMKKDGNPEVIWKQDFLAPSKTHAFTEISMPISVRESSTSAGLTPSLNLVEAFEYLDGTTGNLRLRNANNTDYVYYEKPDDVFANKDARLWGTVILPNSSFRNTTINIQAGVMTWNANTKVYATASSNILGSTNTDGGLLVGADGPLPNTANVTNTGFYLRKYIDSKQSSGETAVGSDVAWIRFRYAEILLNATEAAFELNRPAVALPYINKVRERAGFGANSLATLTIDKIRHEFQVELALEEHRWWDLKRWRIAHILFNGSRTSYNAVTNSLYPYRVIRPADPNLNGKYVFVSKIAPRFTQSRRFQLSNYYSAFTQDALNANPLLIKNPFH